MALSRHDLFVVDPNEYVARRDEVARELRSADDKTGAAEVKKLRRPAVAVWALNQVAAERDDVVRDLVDAAEHARHVQRALLEGTEADDFRVALADRRAAIAAVATAAAAVIAQSGRSDETYARDVESALNVVVSSAELGAALRRSELPALPTDPADLSEMFSDVKIIAETRIRTPPATVTEGTATDRPEPAPAGPSAELVRARAAAEHSQEELSAAEHELEAADDAVLRAEVEAAAAQRIMEHALARRDAVRSHRDDLHARVATSREILERLESP